MTRTELTLLLENLPSHSPAVDKLLVGLQQDSVSAASIEPLLIACPVIAGRVLHLANSTFYGFSRNINSVREAVVILGRHTLFGLVSSIAVIDSISQTAGDTIGFDIERIWDHSLYTACCCKLIAEACERDAQTLFTAAMFQHLGLAILILNHPERLGAALQQHPTDGHDLLACTRQCFGDSYQHLSASALETWHFPVQVCDLVAGTPEDPAFSSILNVGNSIADAMGFTLIPRWYTPLAAARDVQAATGSIADLSALLAQTDHIYQELRPGFLSG